MKTLQTLNLLLFFGPLFGQPKGLYNVLSAKGDTTFGFKYQQTIIKKLSLPKLDSTTNLFYFRLWKANQVIEIWDNGKSEFEGLITSWTNEYVPIDEKPTNRSLIKKIAINADTLNHLVNLIKSSAILNLPSDNFINGWKQGFDGITYVIEFSTKIQYSFKTYWTPEIQDTLKEAKLVHNFVENFSEIANTKSVWQIFSKLIPYECYINGGNIACIVVTKKQKKLYAKERQNYRQHQVCCNLGLTE